MEKFPESVEEFLSGQILLLDKPLGWTSFDVVRKVRNLIRTKYSLKKIKVGHACPTFIFLRLYFVLMRFLTFLTTSNDVQPKGLSRSKICPLKNSSTDSGNFSI